MGEKLDLVNAPQRRGDPVPDQRRGSRAATSCPGPAGSRATRSPGGPFVRVDSGVTRGPRGPRRLRLDVREADRLGRGPRARAAADARAPSPSSRWRACRRRSRSTSGSCESKEFRAGTHTTTWLERALADVDFPSQVDIQPRAERQSAARPADILVEVDGQRVPVRIFDERRATAPEVALGVGGSSRRARARRDPRADAGHDPQGPGGEGPGDPRRRGRLHPGGDEDGEPHRLDARRRGHRAPDPRRSGRRDRARSSPSSTERDTCRSPTTTPCSTDTPSESSPSVSSTWSGACWSSRHGPPRRTR